MQAFKACSSRRAVLGLAVALGLLLLLAAVVWADVINGGFETGDWTGWTPSGSYDIVSAGGDPWIPALQRVYTGQHAARIGNETPVFPISPTWESTLVQVAAVPESEAGLELHYAAVALEAHPDGESAGFSLRVVDLTSDEALYELTSYAYDTGVDNPPPPGWTRQYTIPANSLDYVPWQTVNVDLAGHEGHDIEIEFRVFDCVHGEHWAYGYLDAVVLSGEQLPTPQPTALPPAPEAPVVPEASTLLLFGSAGLALAGYVGLHLRARRRP